jgi:2-amino-4-hydroxy-6-hydroxymethyldihydropteridine diphosphokinase
MPRELAYVGVGANLGDPLGQVRAALAALGGLGELRASSLYRSEPLGDPHQPWYVNAVAELETALGPRALFERLRQLEREAGRPQERVVDEPDLRVPHPRYRERRFVLAPLLELAPQLRDPVDGAPLAGVLADLDDPQGLERL